MDNALIGRLKSIASTQPLELSTDRRSAAKRFEFRVELVLPLKNGGNEAVEYIVARDGACVAVLGQMKDGLPFCLMTNHLLVRCDPANPGGLEEYDGGYPDVLLKADAKEKGATIEFSFRNDLNAPRIMFDAASLLRATINRLTDARWDNREGTAYLRTEHSAVTIVLPRTANPNFGIVEFAFHGDASSIVALSAIHLKSQKPSPLLGITAKAIKSIGLDVRTLTDADRPQIGILAPPDFGTDPRELAAAKSLGHFLDVRRDSVASLDQTQPSSEARDAR